MDVWVLYEKSEAQVKVQADTDVDALRKLVLEGSYFNFGEKKSVTEYNVFLTKGKGKQRLLSPRTLVQSLGITENDSLVIMPDEGSSKIQPEVPLRDFGILCDARRAIKWEFNCTSNDGDGNWTQSAVMVALAPKPFAEGSMRFAYKMRDLSLPNAVFVAKKYKTTHVSSIRDTYFFDVKLQKLAKCYAVEYNKAGPPKPVDFLDTFVIEMAEHNETYAVEKYVEGEFIKYNNNTGYVSQDQRNTPQAFSHFTYEFSKKKLIIVDIQGVDDRYTDPQIHTADSRTSSKLFSQGNWGKKGIDNFIATHVCNPICKYLSLPPLNDLEDTYTGTLPTPKDALQKLWDQTKDERCRLPQAPGVHSPCISTEADPLQEFSPSFTLASSTRSPALTALLSKRSTKPQRRNTLTLVRTLSSDTLRQDAGTEELEDDGRPSPTANQDGEPNDMADNEGKKKEFVVIPFTDFKDALTNLLKNSLAYSKVFDNVQMIGATSSQLSRPAAIKLSEETPPQDDRHSSNSANDSFLLSELALDPVIRRRSPRHADHHRRASAWEPPPSYSDTPRFQLALATSAHRDAVISVDAFRKKRTQRNRNPTLQQQKGLMLQDELACQERGHKMSGVETGQQLRQSDAALFSSRKGDEADEKEDVIPNTDDGCCGFATASKDGTIKVWQNNFEVKGVISSENVTCIKCNADQIVAIKDLDGVEVYDAETCKAICHFNTETNRTLAINESTIAVGNKINKIDVFERRTNGKILTLSGHNLAINALELDGGYTLYSCGDDSHIKIWDLRNSDAPVATLRGHSSGVTSLCLDDGYLFSGATDMQVKLWSLGNRKLKGTLSEHSGYITSLAVNDRYLFSGSDDSIIKVWDKVQLKYINPTLSSIATIDLKYGSAVAMTVVNDTLIVGSKNSIKVFSLV